MATGAEPSVPWERKMAKYGMKKHGKGKGASMGGASGKGHYADHGKAPNWDGKKQGPSKKNKGFGPC